MALEAARAIASAVATPSSVEVPGSLWSAIEKRLSRKAGRGTPALTLGARFGTGTRAAAAIVFVLGIGLLALIFADGASSRAEASAVNYGMLLDALPLDAHKAFRKFLVFYGGKPVAPFEAKRYAPGLNFDLPGTLPGGFVLHTVYTLRFGDEPGVAARYQRGDELLATIFHAPVVPESYGTHKDLSCVIGQHRGRKVEVGLWKLIHLTDRTTCHCVLSRLDEETELPAVMAAVAPNLGDSPIDHDHSTHSRDPPEVD
ncbi:MAG: hypothetical protein IID39_10540 [Planctomycetes bacterium]|nr:hypothetical protein [Planctomycetota bacterium]